MDKVKRIIMKKILQGNLYLFKYVSSKGNTLTDWYLNLFIHVCIHSINTYGIKPPDTSQETER